MGAQPTHFVADSSNGVATAVPGSGAHTNPNAGASDIELAVDASGHPIPGAPPGAPSYQVSITQNGSNQDVVTVNEVGAYSGKTLKTVTYPAGQVPPVLYFDGGNVQVSGNLSSNVTIISGARPQRPTVDAFNPTNPQLVQYPKVSPTITGFDPKSGITTVSDVSVVNTAQLNGQRSALQERLCIAR